MDGAMDFADAIFVETCALELAIHVGGETKLPPGKAALICLQDGEARVRGCAGRG
jgi:hypothetical protein